jgi:lyso-ornithine lipid O-acyltransferase
LVTMRLLGMRLRLRGVPPEGPGMVVSNHLGYLDIVTFSAATAATYVAKSEVQGWPLLGMLARLNGTLFLDRTRPRDAVRVNAELQVKYHQGALLVIFPEGTSSDGSQVHAFKPALLDAAAKARWPVHAASIRYRASGVAAKTALCWHGDMEFIPHFWNLLCRPGFIAEISFAPETVTSGDRRYLAEVLRQQVMAMRPGASLPFPHASPSLQCLRC